MPHLLSGCVTMEDFVATHKVQLLSYAIPEYLWDTLFMKLKLEVMTVDMIQLTLLRSLAKVDNQARYLLFNLFAVVVSLEDDRTWRNALFPITVLEVDQTVLGLGLGLSQPQWCMSGGRCLVLRQQKRCHASTFWYLTLVLPRSQCYGLSSSSSSVSRLFSSALPRLEALETLKLHYDITIYNFHPFNL